MKRTDLSFPLPCLLPSLSGLPASIACTVFETFDATSLVVEAPNWANAYKWGALAALHAWGLLESQSNRLNRWNPADIDRFKMYLLRPGFPLDDKPLWQDSFSYYDPRIRADTLTQRLFPKSGTNEVAIGPPLRFHSIFTETVISPQSLQRFDNRGKLKS